MIKGAGDLASGVALRLHRCGFAVLLCELAQPLAVRRTVAFAQAVYDGACQVEGVTARRVLLAGVDVDIDAHTQVGTAIDAGELPVVVLPADDPAAAARRLAAAWGAAVLVDAIVAKRNTGTQRDDAPLVVAFGPGFVAGPETEAAADCHAVIETQRGHTLGRVIWRGSALPNTGTPGELAGAAPQGAGAARVLRAPAAGRLLPVAQIGDRLAAGAPIGWVQEPSGTQHEIRAPFTGILRGLIHPQAPLTPGIKIGDVDARADLEACFTVSDKALAIAGGVLEAILTASAQRAPQPSGAPLHPSPSPSP